LGVAWADDLSSRVLSTMPVAAWPTWPPYDEAKPSARAHVARLVAALHVHVAHQRREKETRTADARARQRVAAEARGTRLPTLKASPSRYSRPMDLLASLESLTHVERVRQLVAHGRRAAQGDAAAKAELDTLATGQDGWARSLALTSAWGSRDAALVLAGLVDASRTVRSRRQDVHHFK
jgi:hypothetical protein